MFFKKIILQINMDKNNFNKREKRTQNRKELLLEHLFLGGGIFCTLHNIHLDYSDILEHYCYTRNNGKGGVCLKLRIETFEDCYISYKQFASRKNNGNPLK